MPGIPRREWAIDFAGAHLSHLIIMKKNFIKLASLLILSQLACGGVEFRDTSFEPVKGYSEMTYEAGSEEKKVFIASNVSAGRAS